MADRTSAGLFGRIFEVLAKTPTDEHKKIAAEIFELAGDYDFDYREMNAGEACIVLELAVKGIDPNYPEDGETMLFKGEEGFEGVDNAKNTKSV